MEWLVVMIMAMSEEANSAIRTGDGLIACLKYWCVCIGDQYLVNCKSSMDIISKRFYMGIAICRWLNTDGGKWKSIWVSNCWAGSLHSKLRVWKIISVKKIEILEEKYNKGALEYVKYSSGVGSYGVGSQWVLSYVIWYKRMHKLCWSSNGVLNKRS